EAFNPRLREGYLRSDFAVGTVRAPPATLPTELSGRECCDPALVLDNARGGAARYALRRSGGTGRRARLRGVWGNPWGFESPLRHHDPLARGERRGSGWSPVVISGRTGALRPCGI